MMGWGSASSPVPDPYEHLETDGKERAMSTHSEEADSGPGIIKNRTVDIVVSLLFIGLASVFMTDSYRIGFGWVEGQGPASGFFPFYISLIMAVASLINLQRAVMRIEPDGDEVFVGRTSFARVLYVLIPALGYVFAIQYLGIYVASAIFITLFMIFSKGPIWRIFVIGPGVAIALFFMFEKWFLVPLPKGPLEAMLGF